MTPEEKLSAGIVNAHRGQKVTNCGIGKTITEQLVKYKTQIKKQCYRKTRQKVSSLLVNLEELE